MPRINIPVTSNLYCVSVKYSVVKVIEQDHKGSVAIFKHRNLVDSTSRKSANFKTSHTFRKINNLYIITVFFFYNLLKS